MSEEMLFYVKGKHKLDCHCKRDDCNLTILTARLEEGLSEFESECDDMVVYTSGYRCGWHNRAVGGVLFSRHLLGLAVDIAPLVWDDELGEKEQLDYMVEIAEGIFDHVIVYYNQGFIHCHFEPEFQ